MHSAPTDSQGLSHTHDNVPCPLRGWDQIEDPHEVSAVLRRLERTGRVDVYLRPDLYDLAYPGYPGDLDFYLNHAATGSVLYLGIGTGRLFARIARANPNAVGIDLSRQMLDLLLKRNPWIVPTRALVADARTAEFAAKTFDTIIAPFSFLQCFGEEDALRVLSRTREWLRPGGRFYTDVYSPYIIPFLRPGLETTRRLVGGMRVSYFIEYDHLAQQSRELTLFERDGDKDLVLEMNLYHHFPRELRSMLSRAGFTDIKLTGGYAGEAPDPACRDLLVIEAMRPRH